MSIHCGNKFICHNVFKTLFSSTLKPNMQRRKLSSSAVGQVKKSTTATEPMATKATAMDTIAAKKAQIKEMCEYNQRLKSYPMRLLKQSRGQRGVSAILEEMKHKGIQPSNQMYLRLLMGVSLQRHRKRAENRRMESWFEIFLKLELPKRNPWPKLKKAIMAMSFKGHPHMKGMFLKLDGFYTVTDSECWNAAITGCVRDDQLQDAEALLKLAHERRLANSQSYQILIDKYLFLHKQPSAGRIFALMIQQEVAADLAIFESFITYYIALPTNSDNCATLYRLWQAVLMTTTADIPDRMIFAILSYYGMHGELATGEQVYLDIKSRQQRLDRQCLGQVHKIIIGFSNKRRLPSALSLMYDLLGQGYNPSSSVLCELIEACINVGDVEAAHQIVNMVQQVDVAGNLAQSCFDALEKNKKIN